MSDVQIAIIDQQDTQITLAVPGIHGAVGPGVPSGGTAGQLLAKASNADYDCEWVAANPMPLPSFNQVDLTYSGSTVIAASYPSGNPYDYVSLAYSGDTLSQIDYRLGGSGGDLIASYQLVYSGDTLTSVLKL